MTKYYGSIPPGPPRTRDEHRVPRLDADIRDSMEDRVAQPRVYRIWHAPPWGDPEAQHLELFASVLSGSKSAPLDRALVYEDELATSVSAGAWEREIASIFLTTLTVKPGVSPAAVEARAESVLARLLEQGPTPAELDRARARLLSGFARGLERLGGYGGRSNVLAESMTYADDPEAYLRQLRVVQDATPRQVRDTARKWLRAHHYTLTVTPVPEHRASASDLDRSILPALAEAPEVSFPRVQRARLDNGLEILLLERHSAPLVNATLVVDAGHASDAKATAGLASLATDLLLEGTESRDAFDLADALDSIGAQVSTGSRRDVSLVRLRALATEIEPSLALFAEVALAPSFPREMVKLQVERRVAEIAREKASPTQVVRRVIPALLYGQDHPYAVASSGSGRVETVSALGRDHLVEWHRTWFRPESSALVVAGDLTMERLRPLVESAFGAVERSRAPEKAIGAAESSATGRIFLIDKPDAPQSVIVAAHATEAGAHPHDLALEIVMRNFGGMSTSRLNRNLRLDKHWSYGAWGGVSDARGPRAFTVMAPVQADKTVEAMAEVAEEIRGVAGRRPVAGAEFESIMRGVVLRLPGRYETLASLEEAAIDMVSLGRSESWFGDYAKNVRGLGESDLDAAARAFVDPKRLTWLVVGDLAEIEQPVRALGFGEVVVLDADGRRVGGGA